MMLPQKTIIPLTREQVDAANQMWNELPGWQAYDTALEQVARAYPSNTDPTAVLIKAAVLDRLYATNVYNLPAAVERIVHVFSVEPRLSGSELVMALAQVEGKHLVSFASKYTHFYFEKFLPLTDSYAIYALTRHFRVPAARIEDWTRDYFIYYQKLSELKRLSQLAATARETDHYLWLAGNWIAYRRQGPAASSAPPIGPISLFRTCNSNTPTGSR